MSSFIRADDVLRGSLQAGQVQHLDALHGNQDLIRALTLIGVAGPFTRLSPWEFQDSAGQHFVNASGYAALPFGDLAPELTEFVAQYLQSPSQGLPQQSANPWRAALGANLVALLARELPSHSDSGVFFSSSGAEAIEGAIKFARAVRRRSEVYISFSSGYHGKTYGALSLTPNAEYQQMFRPLMRGALHTPYGDLEALERTIRRAGPDNVAAVLIEPIQGEGGVNIPPPGFLRGVGELCRRYGIVTIADEIQTGLGRTGHWFESAAQGLDPDIITLAKPLGGGLTAVGATIVRRPIYRAMLGGLGSKRHSNTFGGNSLSMAVGLKSLELLIDGDLPARSLRLGEAMLGRARQLQAQYPALIEEVRGQGMLLALQFQPPARVPLPGALRDLSMEAISILALRGLHRQGVMANLSLSSKRTVRLTPALNIPEQLLDTLWQRTEAFAAEHPRSRDLIARAPNALLIRLARLALA